MTVNPNLFVLVIAVAFAAGYLWGFINAEKKCMSMIDEALRNKT